MIKVAGVRFRKAGKIYFFGPNNLVLKLGDRVIVETARGIELGVLEQEPMDVEEEKIVSPLRNILRQANEEDEVRFRENQEKKEKALELCQEKVDKHELDMKLIDVEYTFDNSKVIFYFTSEGRVDFRDLVKDLAGIFRMRIELRQIGVRDEAKLIGGIGSCGQPLCCHTWLSEFQPVSIKMAKVQNLSLNPTKISGTCSRLMCCLKYENDNYVEMRKGMPEVGERISTIDGDGIVIESNILEGKVKVRHVIEESDDENPEKLSTDYVTYDKSEIKRAGFGMRTKS